jgi:transcriptional regulator with XRE-family HTH domain
VTFQQVQKYERGANRLSASRLWDFATILGVDISFFFEDLDTVDQERTSIPRVRQEESHGGESFLPDNPMAKTETLELCQAFWRLRPGIRQVFADFLIAASHPRIARTGKDEADAA